MEYPEILDRLAAGCRAALGEDYVGLYVHGSIAMGCFHPRASDIDCVCVAGREPTAAARRAIMDETLALVPFAPEKGLETHVLLRGDCLRPRHPVPFCLHYSPMHTAWYLRDPDDYVARMRGRDPDLAAHLTVLRERGLRWDGPPIAEVFGPVPREAFLDSVLADVADGSGGPVYRLLNLCRALGYLNGAGVLSKKEGGEWFLANRAVEPLVREALSRYAEGLPMDAAPESDALCEALLAEIRSLAAR